MRSLRNSHILLIQPVETVPLLTPVDAAGGDSLHFSPAWELLCLRSHLRDRTGHTCEYVDIRLFDSLKNAIARLDNPAHKGAPRVAVIHGTLDNLAHAVATARGIKERDAEITTLMCGPFPTAFPRHVARFDCFDYAISGDAEQTLRSFLEYSDVEQRLKTIPGLITCGDGEPEPKARFESDISRFTLTDWDGSIWTHYETGLHAGGARIEIRLSRGNPGTDADKPFAGHNEPLRLFSMKEMANLVHKCPGHGIQEAYFSDPPGFWTEQRILEWCEHLDFYRNSQPWAFRILPRTMSDEEIEKLAFRKCTRVELVVPSFDRKILSLLGYTFTDRELNDLIMRLNKHAIRPQLIYWIQGPGSNRNEADNILKHIHSTHALEFSVYPFPLRPDSRLYEDLAEEGTSPRLNEWLTWADDPERNPQPAGIWTGQEGLAAGKQTVRTVSRKMVRNPWFRFLRLLKKRRAGLVTKLKSARSPFNVSNDGPIH